MMKMTTCTALVLALLAGCGGGSGETAPDVIGNTSTEVIVTTGDLVQYKPGDSLTYDYKYNSAYTQDGSGAIDVQGALILNITSSPYATTQIITPIAIVSSVEQGETIVSSMVDYYGYDQSGGLRKYLLDNHLYSNQSDPDAGSVFIVSPLGVGSSWSSTFLEQVEDKTLQITANYSIVGKEKVKNIEALKVLYSGTGKDKCFLSCNETSFSGAMWINPSIGIVKLDENGTFSFNFFEKKYSQSWVLSDFSISSFAQ